MLHTKKIIPDWAKEFSSAITICDSEGTIIYMNEKSCKTFDKFGGEDLIGKCIYNCHPEPSKTMIKELINSQKSNIYTIEKEETKKLIYQSPFYENKKFSGFVEISIELPKVLNNFKRTK